MIAYIESLAKVVDDEKDFITYGDEAIARDRGALGARPE